MRFSLWVPEIHRFATRNVNWAATGWARTASIVAKSISVSTPLRIVAPDEMVAMPWLLGFGAGALCTGSVEPKEALVSLLGERLKGSWRSAQEVEWLPWAVSQRRVSPSLIWPPPTPSRAANGPHGCGTIQTWIIGA